MRKASLAIVAVSLSIGCQAPDAQPLYTYDKGVVRVVNMLDTPVKVSINGKKAIEELGPRTGSNALRAKTGTQKLTIESNGSVLFEGSVEVDKNESRSLYLYKSGDQIQHKLIDKAVVLASVDSAVAVRVVNLSKTALGRVTAMASTVAESVAPGGASETTEISVGNTKIECKKGVQFEFQVNSGPKEAYEIIVDDLGAVLALCSSRRLPVMGVPAQN